MRIRESRSERHSNDKRGETSVRASPFFIFITCLRRVIRACGAVGLQEPSLRPMPREEWQREGADVRYEIRLCRAV